MLRRLWRWLWHDDRDLLAAIQRLEIKIMTELEALQEAVAENATVDQSAITLLAGLAAQIEALRHSPVELQALADNLRASSAALAAAVAANTPAAPAPVKVDLTGAVEVKDVPEV